MKGCEQPQEGKSLMCSPQVTDSWRDRKGLGDKSLTRIPLHPGVFAFT